MTIAVDWDIKHQTKQKKTFPPYLYSNFKLIAGILLHNYSKICLKWPLKKKTDYSLMQVERELSVILSTFIRQPFFFKTFVLSIFE